MTDTPQTRLTCRASNGRFRIAGRPVERGVISYYAALTLPDAESLADWAARINGAMAADQAAGRLEARRATPVKVTGRPELPAPGRRESSRATNHANPGVTRRSTG